MRTVEKKRERRDSRPSIQVSGQDTLEDNDKARHIATLASEDVALAEIPVEDARVLSVLRAHPDSRKLTHDECERIAIEVLSVFCQLDDEEKGIASMLFRMAFGAEEYVPPEYMRAITEISLATSEEKKASAEHTSQRPFMILQFSREIKQNKLYQGIVPKLEEGLAGVDDDIAGIARAVLRTIFGKSDHNDTMDALVLLEWIPSRIIDEYGPADAILEAVDLWQRLRSEGADDEIALAGVSALGAILDDEIAASNLAMHIINNLSIDFDDIHSGIADSVRLIRRKGFS